MRDDIKNTIAQSLGLELEDVEETKLLREDLGLDETELDQILQVIQTKYNFSLLPEEVDNIKSVADLLDTVESSSKATA